MFLFSHLRSFGASVGKSMDTNKAWWQQSLEVFSRLSGWVILPLLAGTLLGRWLDRKFDSSPKWFLIVIGVAFVISMIGLVVQAKNEMKKFPPK